jgi:hypothetical protein
MKTKSLISALAVAVGTLGIATIANARVVDVEIGAAPPPARVEVAPAPREGYFYEPGHYESIDGQNYVWVEGNWSWHHHRYGWHHGHWVRERHGYHYVPARWERDGDRWRYYDSRWDR